MVRALGDGDGRPRCLPRAAAPPKLLIVDLIAKHDIQADEELAREGDFGLGPPASMQDGEVTAPKLVVGARGLGAAWPSTQRRSALPGLVILPRWWLSAEALIAGAKPT
jgi:hypothetical protein